VRLFILCLTVFGAISVHAKSTVSLDAGEEVCIKSEVRYMLRKTKYNNVFVDSVRHVSFWNYFTYDATDTAGLKYTGHIYAYFTETEDKITCQVNYRPNWVLPNPWYVFGLTDDQGTQVVGRMAEIRTKRGRYRF